MRVVHHVGFWANGVLEAKLRSLGVVVDVKLRRATVDVYEDLPTWAVIEAILKNESHTDNVVTEYDAREIANASRLLMTTTLRWGAPLPDGVRGPRWPSLTFAESYRCGWHGPQIAPFRF